MSSGVLRVFGRFPHHLGPQLELATLGPKGVGPVCWFTGAVGPFNVQKWPTLRPFKTHQKFGSQIKTTLQKNASRRQLSNAYTGFTQLCGVEVLVITQSSAVAPLDARFLLGRVKIDFSEHLSTNAKKVTVSVLYWYEKLSGDILSPNF